MAWNERYAATRHFRRRGDRVDRLHGMIIFKSLPHRTSAFEKHSATLAAIGFHFALDVFIDEK